jgi:hypothetical protein
MNTAEVRDAIASSEAILRYIKYEEAWYYNASRPPRKDWITQELSVGVDSVDGGTYGEWSILLGELGGHAAAQHAIFGDAIGAMLAIPDYWQVMEATNDEPEAIEHALIALGFVDKTERINPYASQRT